jgi:hypothetical protein
MVLTAETVASKHRFQACVKKAAVAIRSQAKQLEKQIFRP